MKEILIFAGYLGLFIVEDKGDEIPVPVIIAGIKAYESCFVAEEKKIKRKIYKPKEAPVSLWKIKGRVKQIES